MALNPNNSTGFQFPSATNKPTFPNPPPPNTSRKNLPFPALTPEQEENIRNYEKRQNAPNNLSKPEYFTNENKSPPMINLNQNPPQFNYPKNLFGNQIESPKKIINSNNYDLKFSKRTETRVSKPSQINNPQESIFSNLNRPNNPSRPEYFTNENKSPSTINFNQKLPSLLNYPQKNLFGNPVESPKKGINSNNYDLKFSKKTETDSENLIQPNNPRKSIFSNPNPPIKIVKAPVKSCSLCNEPGKSLVLPCNCRVCNLCLEDQFFQNQKYFCPCCESKLDNATRINIVDFIQMVNIPNSRI
jgi:hypothetical protein